MPDVVVVRARLALGLDLDRPLLREIRRELRRAEAFERAGRTLARRDVSEADLRARLERGGVAPATRRRDRVTRSAAQGRSTTSASPEDELRRSRSGAGAILQSLARLEAEGAPSEAAREASPSFRRSPSGPRSSWQARHRVKAASLLARRGFDHETAEIGPARSGRGCTRRATIGTHSPIHEVPAQEWLSPNRTSRPNHSTDQTTRPDDARRAQTRRTPVAGP